MLNAGDLTQRVTLQRPSSTVDEFGQRSLSWVDVATVWASVQPLRGREWFAAGQVQSGADVRVRIRYRSDVAATWRVVWRGKPMTIVGEPIDVDAERTTLELMCSSSQHEET